MHRFRKEGWVNNFDKNQSKSWSTEQKEYGNFYNPKRQAHHGLPKSKGNHIFDQTQASKSKIREQPEGPTDKKPSHTGSVKAPRKNGGGKFCDKCGQSLNRRHGSAGSSSRSSSSDSSSSGKENAKHCGKGSDACCGKESAPNCEKCCSSCKQSMKTGESKEHHPGGHHSKDHHSGGHHSKDHHSGRHHSKDPHSGGHHAKRDSSSSSSSDESQDGHGKHHHHHHRSASQPASKSSHHSRQRSRTPTPVFEEVGSPGKHGSPGHHSGRSHHSSTSSQNSKSGKNKPGYPAHTPTAYLYPSYYRNEGVQLPEVLSYVQRVTTPKGHELEPRQINHYRQFTTRPDDGNEYVEYRGEDSEERRRYRQRISATGGPKNN